MGVKGVVWGCGWAHTLFERREAFWRMETNWLWLLRLWRVVVFAFL